MSLRAPAACPRGSAAPDPAPGIRQRRALGGCRRPRPGHRRWCCRRRPPGRPDWRRCARPPATSRPARRPCPPRRRLVHGWVTIQPELELSLRARHLGHLLHHVRREPDGTSLVDLATVDGLTNPPHGVCGELVAL